MIRYTDRARRAIIDAAPCFGGPTDPVDPQLARSWIKALESIGPKIAFRADPATGESWGMLAGNRVAFHVTEVGLDIVVSLPSEREGASA